MRIFLTGGTGFLGSYFLRSCLKAGHEVTALLRPGSQPRIHLEGKSHWLEGHLDQITPRQIAGHDALVHLASQGVSPQPTNWNTAFDVNVTQSLKLVQAACAADIPQLLFCGSCYEYGTSGADYDRIPVTAPLMPVGPYAASKAAFSLALAAMAPSATSTFTLLRPFHFFGEGQHESNFWPALRKAAADGRDFEMTAGEQLRDYMPVQEVAKCFLTVLRNWPATRGDMFVANVGSGEPVTLVDFATCWWNQSNAVGILKVGAIPYRPNEVMRFVPEITDLPHISRH